MDTYNKRNGSVEKKVNKPFNGILVFVAYAQKPPLNGHADIFRGTRSRIYLTLVKIIKLFGRKSVNIFLPISFSICFGCSKEPFHCDGYFEYPQNMFWLINKNFLWYALSTKGRSFFFI